MTKSSRYNDAMKRKWGEAGKTKSEILTLADMLGQSPKKLGISGKGIWLSIHKWSKPVLQILQDEVVRGPISKTDFLRLGLVQQRVHDCIVEARV